MAISKETGECSTIAVEQGQISLMPFVYSFDKEDALQRIQGQKAMMSMHLLQRSAGGKVEHVELVLLVTQETMDRYVVKEDDQANI